VAGRDGDGYAVRLGDGSVVAAAGPPDLAEGAAVSVIVRPEDVLLADGGLPARVTAVSYLGPSRSVRLESEALGGLVATVPGNAGPLAEDARVAVSWRGRDAWLVAAA
jgi:hypothetical protein